MYIFLKKNLYQKTEEEFQRNQQRLMSKSEDFHPSVIQNNLKVALMEAEEESENIVEQFLDSECALLKAYFLWYTSEIRYLYFWMSTCLITSDTCRCKWSTFTIFICQSFHSLEKMDVEEFKQRFIQTRSVSILWNFNDI